MNGDQIRRALVRIAHELLEKNGGSENLLLIGIRTRGIPLANRLANYIKDFEGYKDQLKYLKNKHSISLKDYKVVKFNNEPIKIYEVVF